MRDERGRSPAPKRIGEMLGELGGELALETVLASVQMVWDEVVGARIAAVTEVVEEREGTVTVECSSAVWAQELEMMGPRINARLGERLGGAGPENLRFRAAT
jgi:predicted nucleic acid-binding Zn ribbon protein